MYETTSDNRQDSGPRRRTVLLALEWEREPLERGIGDHARKQGWHLLDLRHYSMTLPKSFKPDGILCCLPDSRATLVKQLLRLGVPVVQIDDQVPQDDRPCVLRDGAAEGRIAADHFLSRGFRNLVYIRSERWVSLQSRLTCESFVDYARRQGAKAEAFALQRADQPLPWSRLDALVSRFKAEVSKMELPLGIFTYHDVMAARICHYCAEIGLQVPEQVAVLGAGNIRIQCDCASVPLSSVDPDFYGQGRLAAELLDRILDGQTPPRHAIFVQPCGVVIRQSTDVLAVPDLDVARALRYMWANFGQSLTVRDVAEAAGICRRKLERCFKTYIGRTVNEELTRKRIERCCELLTTTNKPVAAIASEVGFQTGPYLFRLFRRVTGVTPRQYRLARSPLKNAAAREPRQPIVRYERAANLPGASAPPHNSMRIPSLAARGQCANGYIRRRNSVLTVRGAVVRYPLV